jgi:imidazolonepropionase
VTGAPRPAAVTGAREGRGLLVVGAREVATLAGGIRRGSSQDDPLLLDVPEPTVATWEGRVLAIGDRGAVERAMRDAGYDPAGFEMLDAAGGTVTPGLVDPHTHLLFAGSREAEITLRQRGASYLEILAAGGGILSTVAATRAAGEDALRVHGRRWLDAMLRNGVTTIEAKSGYGLDLPTELRLLRIAAALGRDGPIEVVPTFLGLHAVPPEYRERPDGADRYVDAVVDEILPAVAADGHARFCDVFCERGVFSAEQARRYLLAGASLGLGSRLHADQLGASGAAELAADIGALSADHLGAISDDGVAALARVAGGARPVVAVLLPSTALYVPNEPHPPARRLIDEGIPVALGTDFNPGTSPTADLPLVLSLAVLTLGLTAAEALAAATVNAAFALGLGETHGALEPGKAGDLVVWDVPTHRQIPYWLGADLVRTVVKRGRVVWERPS